MSEPVLDAGTDNLVRQRLAAQAELLGAAAQRLDAARRTCFGGTATELVATYRVRTEHQCVPRDLVRIGDRHLLGCEVVLGLKSHTRPEDVFVELVAEGDELRPTALALLDDAQFAKDFGELFQYYREARLLHLRTTDRLLLMVFQAGTRPTDIKVLRWALEGVGPAQRLRYLDNRGERDYVFPPAHDFAWTRTTREQHIQGPHPHINIQDEIFVECVHGDLTVKIEDNTATGQGVYREPVDDPTQGLDDAEWHFAVLEAAILVKVRPYREKDWRHLVYNRRTREVVRLDAVSQSCQQLPEGHGLVFPGGYWLADGTLRRFPLDPAGLEFKRTVRSPAGEDVAYVFYRRDAGSYLIMGYNLIAREVSQPLTAHSWCRDPAGRVLLLRAEGEATRVH
ncbi:MAG: DNA repair ATPase, partial [Planctomycetes bacterium]|nr:DNA repair ATPase [Planctomycetota bacterium]